MLNKMGSKRKLKIPRFSDKVNVIVLSYEASACRIFVRRTSFTISISRNRYKIGDFSSCIEVRVIKVRF